MRFKSVVFALLCLPVLALAILTAPLWVPVLLVLASMVSGLKAFSRTSSERTWNIASYHSPHSLTWRWLVNVMAGRVLSPFRLHLDPGPHFAGFMFSIGIGGAHAYTTNGGWQFGVWIMGLHFHLSQQRPMWFRDMYQRARDEADQLSGHAWLSDSHPNKVRVPPRPTTAMPQAVQ